MATIFDNILKQGISKGIVPAKSRAARTWYRDTAVKLLSNTTASSFDKRMDSSRKTNDMEYGYMYAFKYDPKWKKELPYYDTFPLIFPVKFESDGFLGINFHYLPTVLRAKLMDGLYSTLTNKQYDDTTRVRISYQILQSASKYRYFKPTLKKYLRNHVRSKFLEIHVNEWDIALFLPTESFRKADASYVWEESRKKIGKI
jgi:hypothetical protein